MSDELLERSDELDALAELFNFVRSTGRGHLVLLSGEAGIGKTALIHEFCARLTRVRVLAGACEALRTARPLGPLLDIATETGGDFAALVEAGAHATDVLAALGEDLRRRAPTVLVLEDLHWSDEATLDFLRLLARRVVSLPAFVVLTYRDTELVRGHPLRIALGELSPTALTRISLQALSAAAVARLAAPHGVDPQELHGRTGGNPFYVTEALAAGGTTVPDSVRDAVLARAARLGAGARRLLDAVAIAPPRAELWLLEALAGDGLVHLEECLASGMLRTRADAVAFRHEIARVAVAEALPPDRALALNRTALAALVACDDRRIDLARFAHHAEAAGDARSVLEFAPAAGARAAAVGSHSEAAAQFERALRFAHLLAPDERAELLERASTERFLTADVPQALAARRQAIDEYRRLGDRRREGDARRWLSRLEWYHGDRLAAEREAAAAIALLEQLPPGPELAMAYSNLAQLEMLAGRVEPTLRWGRRAIALGEQLGETAILVHALNNVGTGEIQRGNDDGEELLARSLELALGAGLHDDAARAYCNFATTAMRARDYAAAERHIDEGLAYCAERDLESYVLYIRGWKARLLLDHGRWDEALDAAVPILDDSCAVPPIRVVPGIVRALVRARRGDEAPWPELDDALALARTTAELQRLAPVAAARAEARWLAGQVDLVAAETDDALALALELDDPWATGELLVWRRRAGIVDDIPASSTRGAFRLELDGDLQEAATHWRSLGCAYDAALALLGSDDEAALRSALTSLQQLGAKQTAARIARLLRERGVRDLTRGPRAATRRNPAGLTPRELEVLELVAAGLRNAHIAERLVLSGKTVDHHVSAILRKLNVATRTEAAAQASRLGLLAR